MDIKIVESKRDAKVCDVLLTKLIQDEKKFDKNINPEFVVNGWYETQLDNRDTILIGAYEEDNLIGYLYGKVTDKAGESVKETVALMDAMYIETEYRGRGISKKLIEKFMNWCREKEIHNIDVSVVTENKIANKLYESFGFVEFSKRLKVKI